MPDDPRSLVVLGFDDQLAAREMHTTLVRLAKEGTLLLQDAVFVSSTDDGKVRVTQTTDPSPGQAAFSGAWWGLLFGIIFATPVLGLAIGAGASALLARLIDTGISDEFVKKLRTSIKPGKAYLAVLVSHTNGPKVLEELDRYRGLAELVTSNLTPEAAARVEAALASGEVRTDVSEAESMITA